jgi:hypothetical protein
VDVGVVVVHSEVIGQFLDGNVYVGLWVARWFVFKPKIPLWVNFGGLWNGKLYYMHIWNMLSVIWYI